MELPESTQRELEGLSEADRFKAVMGRLVRVTPEQLRAQEEREQKTESASGPNHNRRHPKTP